jgi:hypothetical protein
VKLLTSPHTSKVAGTVSVVTGVCVTLMLSSWTVVAAQVPALAETLKPALKLLLMGTGQDSLRPERSGSAAKAAAEQYRVVQQATL